METCQEEQQLTAVGKYAARIIAFAKAEYPRHWRKIAAELIDAASEGATSQWQIDTLNALFPIKRI